MSKLFFSLSIAVFTLGACGAGRSTDAGAGREKKRDHSAFAVDFMNTDVLGEAIARAEAEDKLIFVDFYTSWCLPCKLMDEDVFTDRALGDFMNERFVSLKIDAEAGNGVQPREPLQRPGLPDARVFRYPRPRPGPKTRRRLPAGVA